MRKYDALFIDVDNTLLDFYASEDFAIRKVFSENNIRNDDYAVSLYSKINQKYWQMFERGEMSKEKILVERFRETFRELGADADPIKVSKEYFLGLSNCHFLMPDAIEILSYLKEKGYAVYLTTNGVSLTQYKRIEESGIKRFADAVFVSEDAGHQKPEKEYFDYVFANIPKTSPERTLVIGDSMTSDIKGGKNAGLDTCWFDAFGEERKLDTTYTVHSLLELKNIL